MNVERNTSLLTLLNNEWTTCVNSCAQWASSSEPVQTVGCISEKSLSNLLKESATWILCLSLIASSDPPGSGCVRTEWNWERQRLTWYRRWGIWLNEAFTFHEYPFFMTRRSGADFFFYSKNQFLSVYRPSVYCVRYRSGLSVPSAVWPRQQWRMSHRQINTAKVLFVFS